MAILYTLADGVATITLNRPEKRNALNDETIVGLKELMGRAGDDDAVRAIVLRGAGKDFCAGADLSQLERIARAATPEENLADAMKLGDLFIQMRRCAKPILAAVHGNALAGGAGLANACDVTIADENAVFGYPEVKLGFVPAMVMAMLVRAVGEKVAFELAALGNTITAGEAQRIGLVNRVSRGDFDADVSAYAGELAKRSTTAISLIKGLMHGIQGLDFEDAIRRGAEVNVQARLTDDCRNGIARFLERHGK